MTYAIANAQHQGARDEQQDVAAFSDQRSPNVSHAGLLAVLCDGMGGLSFGRASAELAVRTFLESYAQKARDESIPVALERALMSAHAAVTTFARTNDVLGRTGATLVAAVIQDKNLFWISSGDSRGYLFRDGHLVRLTCDHTFGEDMRLAVLKGTPFDRTDVDPDAVTSFMGIPMDRPRIDAALQAYPLQPGDWVLLASDGLYRTLSEPEIAGAIGREPKGDLQRLVQKVVDRANPDQDNVTVLAVACGDGSRPGGLALL